MLASISGSRVRFSSLVTSLVLAVFPLFFAAPAFALTIDTTGSWDGTTEVCCFGETNTATYGQTFTADAVDTQLDSFSFFLNDRVNPDVIDFRAYVYAWGGNFATGPELFESATMSTTNNGGADGFERIDIVTGGIQLTAGVQYVLFLSASEVFDGAVGTGSWGSINAGGSGASTVPGGNFVFQNNTANFGQLFTANWAVRSGDTAFVAEFSAPTPIPEPSTALLFGLGIAGLATRRRI